MRLTLLRKKGMIHSLKSFCYEKDTYICICRKIRAKNKRHSNYSDVYFHRYVRVITGSYPKIKIKFVDNFYLIIFYFR